MTYVYTCVFCVVFFFKQKTAYEMRISDWSSVVCSSDLRARPCCNDAGDADAGTVGVECGPQRYCRQGDAGKAGLPGHRYAARRARPVRRSRRDGVDGAIRRAERSEEHTSELQSLMRISYAVFCLKKKQHTNSNNKRPPRAKTR